MLQDKCSIVHGFKIIYEKHQIYRKTERWVNSSEHLYTTQIQLLTFCFFILGRQATDDMMLKMHQSLSVAFDSMSLHLGVGKLWLAPCFCKEFFSIPTHLHIICGCFRRVFTEFKQGPCGL